MRMYQYIIEYAGALVAVKAGRDAAPKLGTSAAEAERLLITPVQRLPQLSLLIGRLAAVTPPAHPDHSWLEAYTARLHAALCAIDAAKAEYDVAATADREATGRTAALAVAMATPPATATVSARMGSPGEWPLLPAGFDLAVPPNRRHLYGLRAGRQPGGARGGASSAVYELRPGRPGNQPGELLKKRQLLVFDDCILLIKSSSKAASATSPGSLHPRRLLRFDRSTAIGGPVTLPVQRAACHPAELALAAGAEAGAAGEIKLKALSLELPAGRCWLVSLPGPEAAAAFVEIARVVQNATAPRERC